VAVTGVLLFTVDYGLIFWGERHLTSGLTAVLFSTVPLFGLLFAHLVIAAERLTQRKLLGVLLGIAGVVVIFAHQLHQDDPLAPIASVAIIMASASAALSNTFVKAYLTHLDPLVVTAGQMALGVVPLVAIGLATEGNPAAFDWTPLALLSLGYLAMVGSALSFLLFYRLVRLIEVTRVQLLILVNTLVAVALGWLVLGESLGLRGFLGAGAVLAGLGLCFSAPKVEPAFGPSSHR
jgi:drug/metabolite transporter (DMT)-like permease